LHLCDDGDAIRTLDTEAEPSLGVAAGGLIDASLEREYPFEERPGLAGTYLSNAGGPIGARPYPLPR
jgi:hypothetical protein